MSKIAFVFPGQGSQYIGMGKDFYKEFSICREVFHKASDISGIDITKLCFEENSKLHMTEYTQIAILTVEAAILEAISKKIIIPETVAGLSLGEYGALIASGVLHMEDAFRIVKKRGLFMQEAVPKGGAMAAVVGLCSEKVAEVCRETEGLVSIANYNSPEQTVISGAEKAVKDAGASLKMNGAKRILPLNVSGPFHSKMMCAAGKKLEKELNLTKMNEIRIPYISNVTADYVTDVENVKELLVKQVFSPIKWQQSVELMIRDGIDTFIEIGPGKTLTNLLKKIDKNVVGLHVGTIMDLKKL